MRVSEHANYLLNEFGRLQFDYAAYCKPDGESLRNEARNNLETYIAELEADKERLNSCESALISMVNQFFYSKAGENIFRHSFMSAEEEAAEYLVEHGIARWVGKNKSAIYFNSEPV